MPQSIPATLAKPVPPEGNTYRAGLPKNPEWEAFLSGYQGMKALMPARN
jgi:hypothetical protein